MQLNHSQRILAVHGLTAQLESVLRPVHHRPQPLQHPGLIVNNNSLQHEPHPSPLIP
ncbi:hypothetical protein D3C72_2076660 [compost metagenome]